MNEQDFVDFINNSPIIIMFSSHNKLKKKTPAQGIDRREFIEHLVEEYHTTTNVEAQEQVTANLANFAYDPINWEHLKASNALEVFLELLGSQNDKLQLHGSAGLCNICLDVDASKFITNSQNIKIITILLLSTANTEILINCVTLFYQLLAAEVITDKKLLATPAVLKSIINWRQETTDPRLLNICSIFLEDFGCRSEVLESPTSSSAILCYNSVKDASTVQQKKS